MHQNTVQNVRLKKCLLSHETMIYNRAFGTQLAEKRDATAVQGNSSQVNSCLTDFQNYGILVL